MRFHVHLMLTDPDSCEEVANATVSLDAEDDNEAEEMVRRLLADVSFEVQEIESADPTPYCSACWAMKAKDCKCGPIARNE